MRPVLGLVLAFILLATTGGKPVSAAENLGICDSDQDRTTTSDIEAGVEWCFDGESLIVKNESAVVLRIDGGTGLKTNMKTWSSGVDAVLREVGEDGFFVPEEADVFIPGYETTIAVGPNETRIGFIADQELTLAFQKAKAKLKLYGLVPGYGDALEGIEAANAYIGEMDDVDTNYKDCMRRASNPFSKGGCTLGLSGNVTVAVGRAGLAIFPFLNDVPKIVSTITSGVDVALTADELIADFVVDLQAYSWRREVIIAPKQEQVEAAQFENPQTVESVCASATQLMQSLGFDPDNHEGVLVYGTTGKYADYDVITILTDDGFVHIGVLGRRERDQSSTLLYGGSELDLYDAVEDAAERIYYYVDQPSPNCGIQRPADELSQDADSGCQPIPASYGGIHTVEPDGKLTCSEARTVIERYTTGDYPEQDTTSDTFDGWTCSSQLSWTTCSSGNAQISSEYIEGN